MKNHTLLLRLLGLMLMGSLGASVYAEPRSSGNQRHEDHRAADVNKDCCHNDIEFHKLCVDLLCAHKIKADALCVDNLTLKNLCVEHLKAVKATVAKLAVQDVCVGGTLTANGLQACQKCRATAVFATNVSYILGSPLNFNTILDDPNGNVVLSPFKYKVPVSGYYLLSVNVQHTTLTGSQPILGIPVGDITVFANGSPLREVLSPFLSFTDKQRSTLSTLVLLNAGDLLTAQYTVKVLNITTGLQDYVGMVTLSGNGSFPNSTSFGIHYLSTLCKSPLCDSVAVSCGDALSCQACS